LNLIDIANRKLLKFVCCCFVKVTFILWLICDLFFLQLLVKITQLWSYDEDTDEVHPGENVKLKVTGVEEEVKTFNVKENW